MTTMPACHGHSEACCNIPPIVTEGYEAKGKYETIGGLKSYTTGPDDATKAVVMIYDIFGFKDQTIQGADIISTSDSHTKYKVFMPDWFVGNPCSLTIFPPDTKEKQQALGAFLGSNNPGKTAAALPAYVQAIKEKYPSVKTLAITGFCWGGKVVSLVTSGAENPFGAAVAVHPAMVDPKDAVGIKVPIAMLASKDENAEAVAAFEKALTVPHHVETFADQIHGWMAARADLSVQRNKDEYIRGYKTLVEFIGKHLK